MGTWWHGTSPSPSHCQGAGVARSLPPALPALSSHSPAGGFGDIPSPGRAFGSARGFGDILGAAGSAASAPGQPARVPRGFLSRAPAQPVQPRI